MYICTIYVTVKHCFVLQVAVGISANTFLLLFHIFTLLLDHRLKPTDLIICHLTLVHIVNFFIALLLQSPHLFASLNFQNDFKCKALSYLSRAMWGLSICTICLLSVLQAITISSSTSCSNRIFYTVAASNVTQINVLNIGIRGDPTTFTAKVLPQELPLRKGPSRPYCCWQVSLWSSIGWISSSPSPQQCCGHMA
uniref:Vomeronasal type-1 receptor n=1 Tax=Pongo abelii TaxID=9601 RepID=A0A8I5U181_PONAB